MKPYNPLEKKHLAESIVRQLLDSPVESLPPASPIRGAGVYVIYYTGVIKDYPAYRRVALANQDGSFQHPIYVGKAIPKGGRVGSVDRDFDEATSAALYARLMEHAESIDQVDSLDRTDFFCRYLAIDEIWIPLAESLLITRFRPIWNPVVKGFGNHDPGSGRRDQQPSPWDTLHPGRPWVARLKGKPRDAGVIIKALTVFMDRNHYPQGHASELRILPAEQAIVNSVLDELESEESEDEI